MSDAIWRITAFGLIRPTRADAVVDIRGKEMEIGVDFVKNRVTKQQGGDAENNSLAPSAGRGWPEGSGEGDSPLCRRGRVGELGDLRRACLSTWTPR